MGKNGVLAIIITLLLTVSTSSDSNFSSNSQTQSNNSTSEQVSVSNNPVKGEKEVNPSIVKDDKPDIVNEKPNELQGTDDPSKLGSKEPNSTVVNNGGSSETEGHKDKDPQGITNPPGIGSKEPNSTIVNGEKPKDPQGSNDPSKVDSKEPSSPVVDGGDSKTEKEKPKDPQPRGGNESPKLDANGVKVDNNATSGNPPPPGEKKDNEEKGNVDEATNSEVSTNESCQGATNMCRVDTTLLACIQTPQDGSGKLFLLVKNEGDKRAKVNVNIQPPIDNFPPAIKIPKQQSGKIDISSTLGKGTEIVLNAGDGTCRLQLYHGVSVENILQQFSLYSKRVTPIYTAYFIFLVALLFGGTWACCKLRKRRHQDGVPYQELEMGNPDSASATNVVTADGWDQDWDDDWDEENAVKSPGGRNLGNISANGLTSRSAKKDGWENDWDD